VQTTTSPVCVVTSPVKRPTAAARCCCYRCRRPPADASPPSSSSRLPSGGLRAARDAPGPRLLRSVQPASRNRRRASSGCGSRPTPPSGGMSGILPGRPELAACAPRNPNERAKPDGPAGRRPARPAPGEQQTSRKTPIGHARWSPNVGDRRRGRFLSRSLSIDRSRRFTYLASSRRHRGCEKRNRRRRPKNQSVSSLRSVGRASIGRLSAVSFSRSLGVIIHHIKDTCLFCLCVAHSRPNVTAITIV